MNSNIENQHRLDSLGYSPDHHDVQVLSVAVLTRCNGETVAAHLGTLSERLGVPVQVVSDHGSDVLAGIRLWKRAPQEPQRVVETYDITHGLALLLKNQLEPDARWARFVTACQSTRQQLQQTAGCFLRPPAWRSKARFLNLGSHLQWANQMLILLQGAEVATLAEQLGVGVAEAAPWLEEKLGWLREYACEVRAWSYFQEVVTVAEEEIKERGLRVCPIRGSGRFAIMELGVRFVGLESVEHQLDHGQLDERLRGQHA